MKLKSYFIGVVALFALVSADDVLADNSGKFKATQTKKVEKEKTDIEIWWEAVQKGDIAKVKSMFAEKNIDINKKSKYGGTALLFAINSSKIKDVEVRENIVNFLIENGADVNVENSFKTTVLQVAAQKGYLNIVKQLLDRKADINAQDSMGRTALIYSAMYNHTDVLKYLVEHGVDIAAKTRLGYTALLIATERGYIDEVKILLDNGVNIDEVNNLKRNALMTAIRTKYIKKDKEAVKFELVKLLMDHHADINLIDAEGQTALSLAKAQRRIAKDSSDEGKWSEIIKKLEEAGATD